MSRYVSKTLRAFIAKRAGYQCEYCCVYEEAAFLPFQMDHVIGLKHGGEDDPRNLAWTCFPCNNNKGSDIGTVLLPEKRFVRLFNPRDDVWEEHFRMDDGLIEALTDVGEATIKILRMNDVDRIIERRIFAEE